MSESRRYTARVELSNHHCHLSKEAADLLFGKDYEFTPKKRLAGKTFACVETVDVVGPGGMLKQFRILAPVRGRTQVELLRGDCIKLGVQAPVRDSGDLRNAAVLTLIGPVGKITIPCGIIAQRHLHIGIEEAERIGIADGKIVCAEVAGERGLRFDNMLVRTNHVGYYVVHLDMDEGNAAGLSNGDTVDILL